MGTAVGLEVGWAEVGEPVGRAVGRVVGAGEVVGANEGAGICWIVGIGEGG